jgi:GT2 family glycosyltransferase
MCDVSLIIPTRDRPEALRRTLQRLGDWLPASAEVLVYDDSASPGRLESVAREHPNVRLVEGPTRLGVSRAKNLLMGQATSDIIISLDDDMDVLTPDACGIIRRYFEAHPRCGIVSFRVWWSLEAPSPAVTGAAAGAPFECNDFLGGANATRADYFADAGRFAEWMDMYGEEGYVTLAAIQRGWEVHCLPSVLVHHRTTPLEQRANPTLVRKLVRQQLFNQLGIVAGQLPFRFIPLRSLQLLAHYVWRYGMRQSLMGECLSAIATLMRTLPVIVRDASRLTPAQYRRWRTLPSPMYYWTPDGE